jgi:hypothetical protein
MATILGLAVLILILLLPGLHLLKLTHDCRKLDRANRKVCEEIRVLCKELSVELRQVNGMVDNEIRWSIDKTRNRI